MERRRGTLDHRQVEQRVGEVGVTGVFEQTCSCRSLVLSLSSHAASTKDTTSAKFYSEGVTTCSLVLKGDGRRDRTQGTLQLSRGRVSHRSLARESFGGVSAAAAAAAQRHDGGCTDLEVWGSGALQGRHHVATPGISSSSSYAAPCLSVVMMLQCGFIKIGQRKRAGGEGGTTTRCWRVRMRTTTWREVVEEMGRDQRRGPGKRRRRWWSTGDRWRSCVVAVRLRRRVRGVVS